MSTVETPQPSIGKSPRFTLREEEWMGLLNGLLILLVLLVLLVAAVGMCLMAWGMILDSLNEHERDKKNERRKDA